MEKRRDLRTNFFKPIVISSTSIQRAEQIMSQAATKENYDQFDDDDDEELCRVNRFIQKKFSKSYSLFSFSGM
jgi:DnaJ-class molecular chaperone